MEHFYTFGSEQREGPKESLPGEKAIDKDSVGHPNPNLFEVVERKAVDVVQRASRRGQEDVGKMAVVKNFGFSKAANQWNHMRYEIAEDQVRCHFFPDHSRC